MDLSFIHPELVSEVSPKLKSGDFDGAIYDATTYIEAKLQELGQTKAIGIKLVDDIFDNDRFKISGRGEKNDGVKELFSGMFLLIRNDRAHRKSATIKVEIECDNEPDCLKYLGFLSLLLVYLEHNLNTRPVIESLSINQNVELMGSNFDENSKVLVNDDEVEKMSLSPTRIVIPLPEIEQGIIQVKGRYLQSECIEYRVLKKRKDAIQKVVATNIDLFNDRTAKVKIEGITATKFLLIESNREILRISPTNEKYAVGDYVAPIISLGATCGEAWYKDPISSGEIKYAWTGSSIHKGKVVGKAGSFKPTDLKVRPGRVLAEPKEIRSLRAVLTESDGMLSVEKDITELRDCKWSIEDESIAHIDQNGILNTKKLGRSKVKCKFQHFHHEIEVEVATPTTGTKVKYFSNELTKYQQIRFDSQNNLYIANLSPTLHRITSGGKLEKVCTIPQYDDPKYGIGDIQPMIDMLAIDLKDNVYINSSQPRAIYKLEKTRLKEIFKNNKPLKGITVDSRGVIYIGDMDDEIIKISSAGVNEILPIQNHSVDIQLLGDDKIIVGSAGGGNKINIYETKTGNLIRSIQHPNISGVTDIAVWNGEVYVALFHRGEVVKLDLKGDNHTKIADGLGVPGGITFDSNGNLYVSVFDAPNQEDICIYKIYT